MKSALSPVTSELNTYPRRLDIVRGVDNQVIAEAIHRRISKRAYELYEASGFLAGRELAHWLQAECEILNRVPEVRESGAWTVVNLPLPRVRAEGFKVLVSKDKALIEIEEPAFAHSQGQGSRTAITSCYLAEWPTGADPATASAYVKNGTLTLEVKTSAVSSFPSQDTGKRERKQA